MNTVIGLLSNEQNINRELNLLDRAGFAEDDVQVITLDREVEKLLNHEKYGLVAEYAGWGAFLGAIFTVFAFVAAWCECNFLHHSLNFSFEIIPVGLLVGGFIGGFLGLISGIADSENEINPYIQEVRRGGKVIAVQVDEEETEKAKQVLHNGGINRTRILSN